MNKKKFFYWSRLLHVYISTALFSLLIFFSISGITLNHLEWTSGTKKPQLWEGEVPENVLKNFSPPVTEKMMSWLQTTHSLSTASDIEWDGDAQEIMLDFPYPAGYAYVIVNLPKGHYSIDYQARTFWQVLNDLHKGRHAGKSWAWIIDFSAIFIVLFSVTGLVILWQNKSKRKMGFTITLLGTATPVIMYFLLVPNLTGV